eukprot:7379310-Prymnesium_polylepis.2
MGAHRGPCTTGRFVAGDHRQTSPRPSRAPRSRPAEAAAQVEGAQRALPLQHQHELARLERSKLHLQILQHGESAAKRAEGALPLPHQLAPAARQHRFAHVVRCDRGLTHAVVKIGEREPVAEARVGQQAAPAGCEGRVIAAERPKRRRGLNKGRGGMVMHEHVEDEAAQAAADRVVVKHAPERRAKARRRGGIHKREQARLEH